MWRTHLVSPVCKGFHSPSPIRCSTPLIDSLSPLLLVFSSPSRPQPKRTFISCNMQNLQEEFSSCGFHPITNSLYYCAINQFWSHHMKHDFSCFDPHSNWDNWCLRSQQFSIFFVGCIKWLFHVQGLLFIACIKKKSKCHVCYRCNKHAIMYELQKAIKLQKCSRTLIVWNCPLCFCVITVWGKRWNFTHLFGCCTTQSMSLSLRCWSFDLIFIGSWRLKERWACTSWQIFL